MRNPRLVLFALVGVLMFAFPCLQILRYEKVVQSGELYRFRCAPVDPYDPFRGRYVSVGFKDNRVPKRNSLERHKVNGWATVEVGEDGYAKFTEFTTERPKGKDAIACSARSGWREEKEMLILQPTIDRYYMNEELAPRAEKAYRKVFSDKEQKDTCYLDVRILNGRVVPVGLFLNDQPIEKAAASL